jgi:hypothetical protein
LNKLLGHVTIAQGGVLPNIHASMYHSILNCQCLSLTVCFRSPTQEDIWQGWKAKPRAMICFVCCFHGVRRVSCDDNGVSGLAWPGLNDHLWVVVHYHPHQWMDEVLMKFIFWFRFCSFLIYIFVCDLCLWSILNWSLTRKMSKHW